MFCFGVSTRTGCWAETFVWLELEFKLDPLSGSTIALALESVEVFELPIAASAGTLTTGVSASVGAGDGVVSTTGAAE